MGGPAMKKVLLLLLLAAHALPGARGQSLIYNPTFSGTVQSDIDLGGHSLLHVHVNAPSALVQLDASGRLPALDGSLLTNLAWSQLHGAPATLAGYGISDPVLLSSGSYADPAWLASLSWSKLTGTPTTLAGYGIALSGAANQVFAAPNGTSGAASLRALVAADLPSSATVQGNAFNGLSQLVQTTAAGALPALSGAALTALNASSLAAGTVAAARLPSDVAYLDASGTYTGTNAFTQPLGIAPNTARGIAITYTAATGDAFGMEQVSNTQTGDNAALRLFTSPSNVLNYIAMGNYTAPTAYNEYARWVLGTGALLLGTKTDDGANRLQVAGNLKTRHLVGGSAAPTLAAGTGAGTSPTLAVAGTDLAGTVTLTTGASPAASATVATLTFSAAYGASPAALLGPGNAAAAALGGASAVYPVAATGTLAIKSGATALAASTQYVFVYHLAQ